MKRQTLVPIVAFLFCMVLAVRGVSDPAAVDRGNSLHVTCTTTLLSAIVSAVGGDKVDVHTIVPFGMCPGHFDLTPGEADKLRNTDLLLYHGYEPFLKGVAPESNTTMVQAGVKGNWIIPTLHTQAVERIRAILTEARPTASALFAERAANYTRAVNQQAATGMKPLAAVRATPVVCATINRDLTECLGLRVVATFARDEDVSVKALHEILITAKQAEAALVIDNMQSSGKIGRTIADELGVPFVMLSNFPDVSSGAADRRPYLATLSNNCATVLKALHAQAKEE